LLTASYAKDAPLSAIVLFSGSNGPAYTQVTGATLNGKTELRVCDGVATLDKRSYDVLPRVPDQTGICVGGALRTAP